MRNQQRTDHQIDDTLDLDQTQTDSDLQLTCPNSIRPLPASGRDAGTGALSSMST
jgi:hypothetical protein